MSDDNSYIVSIVALVISIIAFVATVLQALQQYYATATGYAKCDPKVMGEWAKSTKRILRPYELRFEVQYEAPVIFLAPANNLSKPIPDKDIWYINGTKESYQNTRTLLPADDKHRKEAMSSKELIHTADNERATWLELLSALQRMESESTEWQERLYLHNPGRHKPPVFGERTLAVAVQGKTKSWDTMPSSMSKPYATTAMCHIVELAAVLGLHWKEFNRSSDKYRAEGNGYILTGNDVSDLGLVFNFQRSGKTKFEENRVIPVGEVKQLCFGFVPTIFCNPADQENLKYPEDEPRDLTILQLGSRREIAETLSIIGCNTNTANYFLRDEKKVGHLFPVVFEILGMLGMTLHARGSAFRMLPNPTIYNWVKKSFSMWKLLKAFRYQISRNDGIQQTDQIVLLERNLEKIFAAKSDRADGDFTVAILDALHEALIDADEYLTEKYVTTDLVLQILRRHIQLVLTQINEGTISGDNVFDELNNETPEHKQARFMEIYFDFIRPEVTKAVANRRQTTFHHAATTSTDSDAAEEPRPTIQHTDTGMDNRHNNIWCTLVFRMLCWLLLHDFHKKDVQISKSELVGSRLPVYVA